MIRCPRCRNLSRDDSQFCTSCGNPFLTSPPTNNKKRNDLVTIVAVVLGVLFSCAICGIIGKLGDSSDKSRPAETATSNTNSFTSQSPQLPPAASPISSPTAAATPRTLISQPSGNSKSATVITENASLRDAPKTEGTVIRDVPEGASVEVIRQKGAWFYVSASGQKGWMHGDAIRYENAEPDRKTDIKAESETDVSTPAPSYSEKPRISTKPREPKINNSGATARCRDGSLSYSQNRRGTCSHHGGVAVWF